MIKLRLWLDEGDLDFNQNLAQLQPVAITEDLGQVGVEALAVDIGAVDAAEILDHDPIALPGNKGVAAGDAFGLGAIVGEIDLRKHIQRRVDPAAEDGFIERNFDFAFGRTYL